VPRARPIFDSPDRSPATLSRFNGFAPNPGDLDAFVHVPTGLPPRAPLVVVLHGCTQDAAVYDHGSGWSALAEAHGFALLYPQQRRSNNPNNCFSWFEPGDTTRGGGEVASIAAMTQAVVAEFGLNPSRVFVTGLSAGGAMTAAMLATYPDIFAGGAIVAGLPYGIANGVPEALGAMSRPGALTASALGERVRGATSFTGPWPRVAVWHGDADRTVVSANGDAAARQWVDVHGLDDGAVVLESISGHPVRRWRDGAGVVQVEAWEIPGMGHGTPIEAATGGAAGAHFLEAGIGSSAHIAAFFGIAPAATASQVTPGAPKRAAAPQFSVPVTPTMPTMPPLVANDSLSGGVAETINAALRAAGLMKG
jgi:poly(hydroxyalkanoate) depolymerase family esterase